jgi:Insect cuticle protein
LAFRYETVGGIVAEEVGTFKNIGLRNEGVRTVGYVEITDPEGVSFRIDYQADSKDAYITPRGEAPRTPPSIIKLLALLEAHK